MKYGQPDIWQLTSGHSTDRQYPIPVEGQINQ